MKKILISLSIIGVVAAIGIGVTIALFNDTETSAGNIFVAGTMDLKVDHLAQTYNDADCKTCSVEVYSLDNTGDTVTERNGVPLTSYPAVHAWVHPNWMTELSFDPSGEAKWIWEHNPTQSPGDTQTNTSYSFQKTFLWMGPVAGATLDLALGSDNMYTVYLNGNQIGQDLSEKNFLSPDHITNIPANYFNQGNNVLKFVVTNKGVAGSTAYSNPAGLIYKFTINGNCNDDYFKTHCQLWGLKDLAPGDTFWNFTDVKAGDHGTNLISLHIYNNNAYACLITHNIIDLENVITNPEAKAGDVTDPPGELSGSIKVFAWEDDGDGNYEVGEPIITGPNAAITTAIGRISLIASNTKNIGVAWCVGTQSLNGNNIVCDGSSTSNIVQTDIMNAYFTAYAEQQRNNENFSCGSVQLPTQPDQEPQGPAPVNLRTAGDFAILSKSGITNSHTSSITGHIGSSPITAAAMDNVFCSEMTGTIYGVDMAYTGSGNTSCFLGLGIYKTLVDNAVLDMETAYTDAAGRAPDATELYGGNLGGRTFAPGVYKWSNNVTIPTDVTLSGGADDVWIFQIAGTLNIASGGDLASGIKVLLPGGAQAKNVFWQVAGATTLGTYSTFNGNILAQTNIAIQTGAVLNGRALAQTAVTLDANTVTKP